MKKVLFISYLILFSIPTVCQTSELVAIAEGISQIRLRANNNIEAFDLRMNNDGILRFLANGTNEVMQINDDTGNTGIGRDAASSTKLTLKNTDFSNSGQWGFQVEILGSGSGSRRGIYSLAKGNTTSRYDVWGAASTDGEHTNLYGVYGSAGTGDGEWGMYCAGNFWLTGTQTSTSDGRLKSNIRSVEKGLAMVMEMKPRTYTFREKSIKGIPLAQGPQIGFVAQELEKVLPQLVETNMHDTFDEDNRETGERVEIKGINYLGLIPVLTKAIQEQQLLIEKLEARIAALEEKS